MTDAGWLVDRRIWANLPTGPWITPNPDNPWTDPMVAEIHRIIKPRIRDNTALQARVRSMVSHGFLTVSHLADGGLEFTKAATCPERPAPRDWVAEENARLAKYHAYNLERMRRKDEQRAYQQRFLNDTDRQEAAQRAEFARLLSEAGFSERLSALEGALERIEAALAAQNGQNNEACNGTQEVAA